jgi:hypothetical protein
VGGFFFDFEAVRTDLTEMLRAGQKESRQSYADWAPSMNLPEAPEARQADRPKVEMGNFFDLGC